MKAGYFTLAAALLAISLASAQAGVVVGGTRLIYDGAKKESALNINNPDAVPYLIQSWVDAQEGDSAKAPFIITPPLFRLDGGQNNLLRVVRAGGNLPADRESLYWLNVKAIPSVEKKDNTLQIAIKTRIKLIYRPQGLSGNLEEAVGKLAWRRNGNSLQVTNPSPYYLTFFNLKLNGSAISGSTMVAPQSTANFPLPAAGGAGGALSWQIINDYGGSGQTFTGSL
ncbi:Chaperone protein focC precursor [Serratia entomophila]|uniref:fimbrial biogenesis chaperone n=1 Tax=Serratia entomophila TaxID=42906 RepID=UPI002178C2F8|nr:molecular chaperone [Serratia entomophila]CAI1076542.1 Chaperone protein focC precursor [Serratia entomophila]CAI1095869.1 Chaperone protein focC precursor [Serratia entomophila]CAI2119590.1 Chaperone protein focC precursor [Serratia entomophila]